MKNLRISIAQALIVLADFISILWVVMIMTIFISLMMICVIGLTTVFAFSSWLTEINPLVTFAALISSAIFGYLLVIKWGGIERCLNLSIIVFDYLTKPAEIFESWTRRNLEQQESK